jgi:hypothetical protein
VFLHSMHRHFPFNVALRRDFAVSRSSFINQSQSRVGVFVAERSFSVKKCAEPENRFESGARSDAHRIQIR